MYHGTVDDAVRLLRLHRLAQRRGDRAALLILEPKVMTVTARFGPTVLAARVASA